MDDEQIRAKVYVLADVVAEIQAKHPKIVINVGKGAPIEVDPPQLWPDNITELGTDNVAIAKQVMGEAQYRRFAAAGGSAAIFSEIVQDYARASLGESSAS